MSTGVSPNPRTLPARVLNTNPAIYFGDYAGLRHGVQQLCDFVSLQYNLDSYRILPDPNQEHQVLAPFPITTFMFAYVGGKSLGAA